MSHVYEVRAEFEPGIAYWALTFDDPMNVTGGGTGATQVKSLDKAEYMVRDWLESTEHPDAHTAEVVVTPVVEGFDAKALENERKVAEAAQAHAARMARQAVEALLAKGLSRRDVATLLGVTPGRVSHLRPRNVVG